MATYYVRSGHASKAARTPNTCEVSIGSESRWVLTDPAAYVFSFRGGGSTFDGRRNPSDLRLRVQRAFGVATCGPLCGSRLPRRTAW